MDAQMVKVDTQEVSLGSIKSLQQKTLDRSTGYGVLVITFHDGCIQRLYFDDESERIDAYGKLLSNCICFQVREMIGGIK